MAEVTTVERKPQIRDARAWLAMPVWLNRGRVLGLAWLLGLILAAMSYTFVAQLESARTQREALQASDFEQGEAIRRLKVLEDLPPVIARERIEKFLDAATPREVRRAMRLALSGLTPRQRARLLGGD